MPLKKRWRTPRSLFAGQVKSLVNDEDFVDAVLVLKSEYDRYAVLLKDVGLINLTVGKHKVNIHDWKFAVYSDMNKNKTNAKMHIG